MKFDPKKMIDSTLDQMSESSRRRDGRPRDSYGREGDVEDLIHRITRDLEEIRIKNRDLNDRINDLEMKFSRLKDLMRDRR
jgi:hypothetical protein